MIKNHHRFSQMQLLHTHMALLVFEMMKGLNLRPKSHFIQDMSKTVRYKKVEMIEGIKLAKKRENGCKPHCF